MRGPAGRVKIDVEDLLGFAEAAGVRTVLLSIVAEEVEHGLAGAIADAYGTTFRPYELLRRQKNTQRKAQELAQRMETANPAIPPGAIAEAREFFHRHPRDMAPFSVRDKSSVPGPNDLRLILQAAALGSPTHLVTRDGHFLAYADVLRERWRITVHDGARLPFLLLEWRAHL